MVGLLILKHVRNISDESVVEQWQENVYYQYFCGEKVFAVGAPCNATELVHFRHRIGEEGIALILKESIRINGKDGLDKDVMIDTTVQEKNITFPTDEKLYRKVIDQCRKIADKENVELRQSYTQTVPKLRWAIRSKRTPGQKKQSGKALRKLRTIAGRLFREIDRNLDGITRKKYEKQLDIYKRVIDQQRGDKNKIYSIHEPQTRCIAKGKEHKKYEFGSKVSIVRTKAGVIVGALNFADNPYDGHTLDKALEQCITLRGTAPQKATVDQGYRGVSKVGITEIINPKTKLKSNTDYAKRKRKEEMHSRSAIEPTISHLKHHQRLSRNFYKHTFGDNINVMLAAAAFNFKRAMNLLKRFFYNCIEQFEILSITLTKISQSLYQTFEPEMTF
jgi:IS5 family transposase